MVKTSTYILTYAALLFGFIAILSIGFSIGVDYGMSISAPHRHTEQPCSLN